MIEVDRIICGDATQVLSTLAGGIADLTVTSPPYFRHRDYGVDGQLGREATVHDYIENIRAILRELLRVTAKTGACFFVVGDTYEKQKLLLVPHRIAIIADELGWTVRNDLIWNKLDPVPGRSRNRWRSAYEHVLFLTRQPDKYKFHTDAIRVPYSEATLKRWGKGQAYGGPKSEGRKNQNYSPMRHGETFKLNPKGCLPTDVWSLPAGDSPVRHYATFPDRLVKPIMLACSSPAELVLDPFAGSGTTCRIAKEMDRRFIGIELNPEYAEMAAKGTDTKVVSGAVILNAQPK